MSANDPMRWRKLGPILVPGPDVWWMESHVGPTFIDTTGGRLRAFVTGRDRHNISRVGVVDLSLSADTCAVDAVSPGVVFDVGEWGAFDESGVSYPWLVHHDGRTFMYYVGWVAGGLTRFQNFTGLAVSDDDGQSFRRVSKAPVLERTDAEPVGSGSCCVFIEDDVWKMYYTSFEPWLPHPEKARPSYNIKFATSSDGVQWHRDGRVIVDFAGDEEYVIGKPALVRDGDLYRLWYSHRGPAYRIGYAESRDGLHYDRQDHRVGIGVSASGWDDQMVEYAFVFDHAGRRYMVYNGNGFGKTGLGLAILDES